MCGRDGEKEHKGQVCFGRKSFVFRGGWGAFFCSQTTSSSHGLVIDYNCMCLCVFVYASVNVFALGGQLAQEDTTFSTSILLSKLKLNT